MCVIKNPTHAQYAYLEGSRLDTQTLQHALLVLLSNFNIHILVGCPESALAERGTDSQQQLNMFCWHALLE